MNRIKVVATIFCLSLAFLAFSPSVKADGWNKKTVVTFSQPVERLAPMSSSCWTLYSIVTSFRFSTRIKHTSMRLSSRYRIGVWM